MDEDADLPLHDEAKARAKWRGDETVLNKAGKDAADLASEIDDAADQVEQGTIDPSDRLMKDLGERPPD